MANYIKFFSFAFFSVTLLACSGSNKIPTEFGSDQISKNIKYLASDELAGRATGTPQEQLAATYIADQFKKMGVKPMGDDESYFQLYTAYDSGNPHADEEEKKETGTAINGRNVIGFRDNNAPFTVVIGAHYDHLGMGNFGSLHNGEPAIHNGADDNASGIAVMLYLAKRLKSKEFEHNNYLFIAFSGEEKGLWGSNYWTKNSTYSLDKINYMINLDMVGRMKENKIAINGTGTSPAWSILDDVNEKHSLVKSESGIGPSDHTSFYLQDIPAIHFFTGQHEDYHKPTDDYDKINFKGCYEVAFYILDIINGLDGTKIAFTKTKDEKQEVRSFKVTLGVIPDYMFQGDGMRIDGVKEDRPASNAGIQNGDVVIKMGDIEIKDMMSYMKSLGKFEPGQTVPVIIKRGEEEISMEVTF